MAQFPWPKDAFAAEVCCQEALKLWRKGCCALGLETSPHSMSLVVDICKLCVCQWLLRRLYSQLSVVVLLFRVEEQTTTHRLEWWCPAQKWMCWMAEEDSWPSMESSLFLHEDSSCWRRERFSDNRFLTKNEKKVSDMRSLTTCLSLLDFLCTLRACCLSLVQTQFLTSASSTRRLSSSHSETHDLQQKSLWSCIRDGVTNKRDSTRAVKEKHPDLWSTSGV